MRKVIGIGETVFDIIFRGDQPVRAIPGGSTYNSMISLGRVGVPAVFIGETGEDRVGEQIVRFLEENHVSSESVCVHKSQKSALSLAFLNAQNDAEYVFYKDHSQDRLDFRYPDIQPDDVVLYGSYYSINEVVRGQVRAFLEYASERGAILYYDLNFRSSHKSEAMRLMKNIRENMALADVVRGSHEDFLVLLEKHGVDVIYETEIAHYCKNFIYTCGAEPAILRGADGLRRDYPVKRVRTVSTVGAGDSFNAGFAYGLLRHRVTREGLRQGLCVRTWDALFACAQGFSANVCQSLNNYIDQDYGDQMARE